MQDFKSEYNELGDSCLLKTDTMDSNEAQTIENQYDRFEDSLFNALYNKSMKIMYTGIKIELIPISHLE